MMFMKLICMFCNLSIELTLNYDYFSDDIFHGLDIESEMEKIDHRRRPKKQLGWGDDQEELSLCEPDLFVIP